MLGRILNMLYWLLWQYFILLLSSVLSYMKPNRKRWAAVLSTNSIICIYEQKLVSYIRDANDACGSSAPVVIAVLKHDLEMEVDVFLNAGA